MTFSVLIWIAGDVIFFYGYQLPIFYSFHKGIGAGPNSAEPASKAHSNADRKQGIFHHHYCTTILIDNVNAKNPFFIMI